MATSRRIGYPIAPEANPGRGSGGVALGYACPVARPVWSGTITFGLVNIPVKALTAVRDHDVHFHQLQKRTGSRIRYRKVAEKSGREVEQDDIEMGYELSKGRYVTFDKDELDELRPESTRAVEVSDFVALDDIDPIYYERTYWLVPSDEPAKKGYQLLRAAMEERNLVGIGTVVMRNKQYLTAIRPLDGALAMSTMRFADEVVPRSETEDLPRRTKPDPKSLRMALQLIDAMSTEWEPRRYEDTYTEELRQRIKAKDEGKEIVEAAEPPEPTGKVVDLMAALEASVDAAKGGRSRSSRGGARSPKSRGTKRRKSA
jgi:DNA end-binding protein Ku